MGALSATSLAGSTTVRGGGAKAETKEGDWVSGASVVASAVIGRVVTLLARGEVTWYGAPFIVTVGRLPSSRLAT